MSCAGQVQQAVRLAESITETSERILALALVGQVEQAVALAQKIVDPNEQVEILDRVAFKLAEADQFEQATHIAQLTTDSDDRREALISVVYGMIEDRSYPSYNLIRNHKETARALSKWGGSLTQVGSTKAQILFEQTALLIQMIYHPKAQKMATSAFANTLVKAERFSDAFSVLGSQSFDEFLETLAGWAIAFEQVRSGLAPAVLEEAIGVLGWVHPYWHNINQSLASTKSAMEA